MAQTGYTPISLYYSTTASTAPTAGNLIAGELAINTTDGKLYYKDTAGVVQVIASKDANSGSFTSITDSGNLTFTGTGNRITGDFSNATVANRVAFQTSTTNNNTVIYAIPNGTGTVSAFVALNNSDVANASATQLITTSTESALRAQRNGTGTYLPLTFQTNNTEAMRIDTSGNVGIGTSTPGALLHLNKASGAADIRLASANTLYGTLYASSSDATLSSVSAIPLVFGTNNTERMRIDSSGTLFLGQTTNPATSSMIVKVPTSSGNGINFQATGSALSYAISFYNNTAGLSGYVSFSGTTTSYVTTSDYRLKENIAPMSGALKKVQQLNPVTYKWKADGSSGQGFIAHELQAVVPECVVGEKDGMRTEQYEISPAIPAEIDEDGNVIKEAVEAVMGEREVPEYQGIDTSFLVATLTAAIQELNAKVTALETQLAAKG